MPGSSEPPSAMPKSDDSSGDAFRRLDKKLDAFQAQRAAPAGAIAQASSGYRLFGEVIGGVLGGLGLGWTIDHFAHTGPWGTVIGVLTGVGASVYVAVRGALRMSDQVKAEVGVAPDAPPDDEEN
jgi:ATP synthase protein I